MDDHESEQSPSPTNSPPTTAATKIIALFLVAIIALSIGDELKGQWKDVLYYFAVACVILAAIVIMRIRPPVPKIGRLSNSLAAESQVREFPYGMSPRLIGISFLIVAPGEALLVWYGVSESDTLLLIMASICSIVFIALAAQLGAWILLKRRVVVTSNCLTIPKPTWHGLSSQEISIPLATIREFRLVHEHLHSTLVIAYNEKHIVLVSLYFPRRAIFNEFASALVDELNRRPVVEADRK